MPRSHHTLDFDLLSRVLICVALLFSLFLGLTFWNRVVIQQNKFGYRPSTFVVTEAHFGSLDDGTVEYWLIGNIASLEERFFPKFAGKDRPKRTADLFAVYPKGTEINVLYNPDVSDLISRNGETLRVIEAGPDFWQEESRKLHRSIALTFGPVPLAVSFFLVVRHVKRRRENLEAAHVSA